MQKKKKYFKYFEIRISALEVRHKIADALT